MYMAHVRQPGCGWKIYKAELGFQMRILVSDYSGHPFQVQLSRALAGCGHDMLHISSASLQTPKGKLGADAADPPTFRVIGVTTKEPFAKYSFIKRRRQEIEVGHKIAEQIAAFAPDIVVSGNAPLDTQRLIQRATHKANAAFIFWVQDLYAEAMLKILPGKFGPLGTLIGQYYRRLENAMIRRSDHVVVISPEFATAVEKLTGIPAARISVIENWAPLEDLELKPRNNIWAKANLPAAPFRAIYSGTLGFKHNPDLLLKLAKGIDGEVIIFSEGPAAEALQRQATAENVTNLRVSGWLPFETLPDALGGADLLIVILEPEAGIFSVPSKILTYMCAGRPILGSIPSVNLAARLIKDNGAGIVVSPEDEDSFVGAAHKLVADTKTRDKMGKAARAYAEKAFDIDLIRKRFETIFTDIKIRNAGGLK
jgi:glycosyltransferase involved in cell wall biosynthesis